MQHLVVLGRRELTFTRDFPARDGAPVEVGGVMIFGVADDLIRWDRLYLEPHLMAEATLDEFAAESPRD